MDNEELKRKILDFSDYECPDGIQVVMDPTKEL
jgi:hypothetical protein